MGQCQSIQQKPVDPLIGTSISLTPQDINHVHVFDQLLSYSPPPKDKRKSSSIFKRKSRLARRGTGNTTCKNKGNKLIIETTTTTHHPANDDNDPLSPSERTQPETPASLIEPSTPKSLVSMISALTATAAIRGTNGRTSTRKYFTTPSNQIAVRRSNTYCNNAEDYEDVPYDDDDDDHNMMEQHHQQQHGLLLSPSLLLTDLDNVMMIPEEVDPDAPSDEEESYQKLVESSSSSMHHKLSKWEMEPGPIVSAASPRNVSPPRPQSSIKRRHKHVTRANSIQRHCTPLVAPGSAAPLPKTPRGSVDRQTMAEFNKLKVQVQLKEHEHKVQRRQKKLEDRYEDVHKSRTMYKDFVDMQDAVSVVSADRSMSSRKSFDLKDTHSWYYDFGSVVGSDEEDSDDERSQYSHQSQYSLLSSASMESQRKFYAAKKNGGCGPSKTTTKIEELEATLKRLNAAKNKGNGDDNASEKVLGDYGPRAVRRPSINSEYGPAKQTPGRRMSNASSILSDHDPMLSRSNSLRSLPIDYGRLAVNDDAISKASSQKQEPMTKDAMQEYLVDMEERIATPVRSGIVVPSGDLLANFLSPERSIHDEDEIATPFSVIKRTSATTKATSERIHTLRQEGAPPSDEQSLICAASSPPKVRPSSSSTSPKALHSTPPSKKKPIPQAGPPSDERKRDQQLQKEKKQDSGIGRRSPHWRSFLDNSPSNHKRTASPSKPAPRPPVGSIFNMSTEEFLMMADEHAVVRISKVPSSSKSGEGGEDDTVVKARRLNFANDEENDEGGRP